MPLPLSAPPGEDDESEQKDLVCSARGGCWPVLLEDLSMPAPEAQTCALGDAHGAELHRYFSTTKAALISVRADGVTWCRRLDGDWTVLARKKADCPHSQWLSGKAALVAALDRWQREVRELPSWRELQAWAADGICDTPTGHRVEPDGQGPDGVPSWLRLLHLI
jgi:hypothetical protein